MDPAVASRSRPIADPTGIPRPVEPSVADVEIQSAANLLAATPESDPRYADQLFLLGQAYARKAAWFGLDSGAHGDAEAEAWAACVDTLGKLLADPSSASYARIDEALYLAARAYGVLGSEPEMQTSYQRLIMERPNSPLIPYAYLQFANYYYRKGALDNAVRLYERVVQFSDSPVYTYALYRLAWCHLEPIGAPDPRPDKSLNYFVMAISAVRDGRAPSAQAGEAIMLAAQDDLVLAYAQCGKPRKAEGFLGKYAPGRVDALLQALAREYAALGMDAERGTICEVLVSRGELACD